MSDPIQLEERRYALDQKVAHVEQNQAVLEARLDEVKAIVTRLESNYTGHVNKDDKDMEAVRSELRTLDKDVSLQRNDINNVKVMLLNIEKAFKELQESVNSSVAQIKTSVDTLDKKLVRITAYGAGALAVVMIIKDPILRALGLT